MKKKHLLLSSMLMLLGSGMVQAQKAYTYVQQNGTKIDKLGTAAFDLSSSPTVEFVDGKAVMTMSGNTVAKLPMSNGGQLVVEFTTTMADADLNKVKKTFTNPYATIYSPFQLEIPSGSSVSVYDPKYTSGNTVGLTEVDGIVPVETPLVLRNAGTIEFGISADASTATPSGNFSGSSLAISVPAVGSGETLYTLGHDKTDASKYGFFSYTGTTLGAGLCYLVTETVSGVKALYFDGFDEESGIEILAQSTKDKAQSAVYNLAGQRVNSSAKGIVISNGKKYIIK